MAPKRTAGDDADLVKLYLKDIGQYPLLTKGDEARLAQAIEAGRDATALVASAATLTPAETRELRRIERRAAEARQAEDPGDDKVTVAHQEVNDLDGNGHKGHEYDHDLHALTQRGCRPVP